MACCLGVGEQSSSSPVWLLPLLLGNTNMEWKQEMDGEVTCTHLAALAPCAWLNRELLVLEHWQRPLGNHGGGSVPEDRQAAGALPPLKRGKNVGSEPTDRHTFSMEDIKMDYYQVFGFIQKRKWVPLGPNMGLFGTILVK